MCGNQMAAEGRPLSRQVRGAEEYEDILAGNDFLSVLLESSHPRLQRETTPVTEERLDLLEETMSTEPYTRETREAEDYFDEVPQTTEVRSITNSTSDSSSSDGVIIAVHVSSSVDSQINKDNRVAKDSLRESTTTHILDQNFLSSEEYPSILANSAKSELTVEEPAPITKNNDEVSNDSTAAMNRLQATIQNLPSSQHVAFNPAGFSSSQNKDNLPPFHHSFVYHDNPSQPGRARSVSYSTIIQDIQPTNEKHSETLERKERNYETGMVFRNSYENPIEKAKEINLEAKMDPEIYTSTTTTTPASSVATWQQNESPSSAAKTETTEANWSKSFTPPIQQLPKIYGKPEQNYEVDEAVSVVTNGRTHGVQAPQNSATQKPTSDQDKDQKVGYVVEGRNYRKYRVEERTSDGFIVGEYGVVSHDDGSLRGVRYTADGTINPRLIYDALMKFLSL